VTHGSILFLPLLIPKELKLQLLLIFEAPQFFVAMQNLSLQSNKDQPPNQVFTKLASSFRTHSELKILSQST